VVLSRTCKLCLFYIWLLLLLLHSKMFLTWHTITSFNSERVYLAHRGFTVIDPKFREMLQNDIRGVFLKRYKTFFDKYSRIQFSKKNMETYLKYSPQKIDSLVSQLFAQV
jgi:hypothetical protein